MLAEKIRPLRTAITGNLNGVASGADTNLASVNIDNVPPGGLGAYVNVDVETNTFTMAASWEVSRNGSTFYRVSSSPQNAANVVLGTGTAGADAAITKFVAAPTCVCAWKFARMVITAGGTTGASADTYSVQYKIAEGPYSGVIKNDGAATGTFNGSAAGTQKAGNKLSLKPVVRGSLGALVTVLAETNTLTIEAQWQVSDDASTWYDIVEPQNPANVVLATGTAGADSAVTRVVPAPQAVHDWKYARCTVINRVTTGGASDTYSITHYWLSEGL